MFNISVVLVKYKFYHTLLLKKSPNFKKNNNL